MFSLKDPSTTGVACKKAKVNCRLQIYICSAEDAMVDLRMSGAFTQSQPGFLQLRFHPSGIVEKRDVADNKTLSFTMGAFCYTPQPLHFLLVSKRESHDSVAAICYHSSQVAVGGMEWGRPLL